MLPSLHMSMPSSKKGIQGPRPNPLKITQNPQKSKKPVVYYEQTPKIVHTSPQEFRDVVQQLTGRSETPESSKEFCLNQDEIRGGGDDSMLLLTLGRHGNGDKGALSGSSPNFVFSGDKGALSGSSPNFVFSSPSIVRSSDR